MNQPALRVVAGDPKPVQIRPVLPAAPVPGLERWVTPEHLRCTSLDEPCVEVWRGTPNQPRTLTHYHSARVTPETLSAAWWRRLLPGVELRITHRPRGVVGQGSAERYSLGTWQADEDPAELAPRVVQVDLPGVGVVDAWRLATGADGTLTYVVGPDGLRAMREALHGSP